ncbi:putative transcription factor C2H2 family [Helianthus annuus]|uniref:RING-type E3 ubiquitin transferase n=1 Tax=Helianthus annuus TaxID=4232 RepID=A0A251TQ66_HELAN|nr:putative RING-H2 finger protein ATL12 [Helianthus annuus]KAF5788499.1 putative transcription factor C2H2 family [Helianthus annuus]
MNIPACIPEFQFLETPVTQQNKLILIIIHLTIIISSNPTNSQSLSSSPTDDNTPKSTDSGDRFQPSLVVVIGVLTLMLSLTFLLLIYAKLWHTPSSLQYLNQENFGGLTRSVIRVSGIDKTVIESLPVFRFSTLKGWRNGLECSICLSRFEDVEVLRLLPKCKHAFHIGCVDKWLENHSGCPLCRCEVSEEDVTRCEFSSSLRFLSNRSAREGLNLELFVEREGSARFGSGRSVGNIEVDEYDEEVLHKFNHRIIISDIEYGLMGKNRWSSLSSSDLLVLKSEMITSLSSNFFHNDQDQTSVASMSSNKFDRYPVIKTGLNNNDHDHHDHHKIKEEIKRKREFEQSAKLVEKRSMSEIIVHPRFLGVESSNKEANGEVSANEDRLKKLWLPIARRTIQMFASRDQPPEISTRTQVL